MGMADSYYIQPDYPEIECQSCEGTENDCPDCEGTGLVVRICDLCDSYPCRCDDEYDRYRDNQLFRDDD